VAVVTSLQMDLAPSDHTLILFLAYASCLGVLLVAPLYGAYRIHRYLTTIALGGKGLAVVVAGEINPYAYGPREVVLPGEDGSALKLKGSDYVTQSDREFDMVFGPLFYGLKLTHWWFFLVVMGSRLVDGFLISFLRSDGNTQVFCLLLNAVALCAAYWYGRPFLRDTEYRLYAVSLSCLVLAFLSLVILFVCFSTFGFPLLVLCDAVLCGMCVLQAMQVLRVALLLISIGFVVKGADAEMLGVAVIVIHATVCVLFLLIRLYDVYHKIVRLCNAPKEVVHPPFVFACFVLLF
jgi:hypothetical protein